MIWFLGWSLLVLIGYALFPSSDTTALVALVVWGFGAFVWMVADDKDFWPDVRTIFRSLR